MQRLLAGWREGRRVIGSLIGLTDEQFNRETDGPPGQWTYRVVAKHRPRGRKRPSLFFLDRNFICPYGFSIR
jgi:hypothetical protein